MIGTTLREISDHIESLASDTGEYSLACARYGDRPVPAARLRFESRSAARAAARATEQYRDALRRYDPQVPYYDVIVRQEYAAGGLTAGSDAGPSEQSINESRERARSADESRERNPPHDVRRFSAEEAAKWSLSEPAVGRRRDSRDSRDRRREFVNFCHDAAASVFEALSAADHDAVESTVMEAYFDLAERLTDPDDLCVCLLEAMASELRRGLDPTERASVLADAASRLPSTSDTDPVTGAFDRLVRAGVVGSYAHDPLPATPGAISVRVSEYALTPRDGRFPTLPIVLELYRRGKRDARPGTVRVAPADGGWRLRFRFGSVDDPSGLTSATIRR